MVRGFVQSILAPFIILSLSVQAGPANFRIEVDGKKLELKPHNGDPARKPIANLSFRSFEARTSGAELFIKDTNSLFDFDIYAKPGALAFVSDAVQGQVFDLAPETYEALTQIDYLFLKDFYLKDTYSYFRFIDRLAQIEKDNMNINIKNIDIECRKTGEGFEAVKEGCLQNGEFKALEGSQTADVDISFTKKVEDDSSSFLEKISLTFESIVFEATNVTAKLSTLVMSFISPEGSSNLSLEGIDLETSEEEILFSLKDKVFIKKDKLEIRGNNLSVLCQKKSDFRTLEIGDYKDSCLNSLEIKPLVPSSKVKVKYELESSQAQVDVSPIYVKTKQGKTVATTPKVVTYIGDLRIESQNARLDCFLQEGVEGEYVKNCQSNFFVLSKGSKISSQKDTKLDITTSQDFAEIKDAKELSFKISNLEMGFEDDVKRIKEISGSCAWERTANVFDKKDIVKNCLESSHFDLLALSSIEKNFSKEEEEKRRSFLRGFNGPFKKIKLKKLIDFVRFDVDRSYLKGVVKAKLPLVGMREIKIEGDLRFSEEEGALFLNLDKLKVLGLSLEKREFIVRLFDKIPMVEVVDAKEKLIKIEVLK